MHPAFVLAAGLGTRLRPLTDELAKPLVPVGDTPLLGHVVRSVRAAGFGRVVANAHFRAEDVLAYGRANDVAVAHETELLGTAGGLANAAPLLGDGAVLIYNGDIYAPGLELERLAPRLGDALAVLVVRPRPAGEGNVGLRDDGTVVRLRKQSFAPEARGGEFLGIHLVAPAFRALTPAQGGLIEDVYLPAMARGLEVRAFCTDVPFVDVGTPAGYAAANAAWLASRGLGAWAHETARVACILDGSVVGAGAEVSGPSDAALTRCVVWPRARVMAPLADHFVTPRGALAVHAAVGSATLRP